MKAVNLIPEDLRGGAAGTPGRSGPAVYVLLGALALGVLVLAAVTVYGARVTEKENELARVTVEAQQAQAEAARLAPYRTFSDLRAKRVETVASLSRSRFNWPYALREVSRVLPSDVWLSTLSGTVSPGVQIEGGSGGTAGLRSAVQAPAIELSGCTTDNRQVARYLARLRSIEGVTRVALGQAEKLDSAGGGGGGASAGGPSDGDCRQGDAKVPKFDAVVFFETSAATPSAVASGGAAPAPAPAPAPAQGGQQPTTTTPGTQATPASQTTTTPQGSTR